MNTPETDAVLSQYAHHLPNWLATEIVGELAKRLERSRNEWQTCAMIKMITKTLSCMWCGEIVHAPKGFRPGTPLTDDQRKQAYQEHVSTCPAHPIREVERERNDAQQEIIRTRDFMDHGFKKAKIIIDDAAELLAEIMRDEVNHQDEAEKWLRSYAPHHLFSDER